MWRTHSFVPLASPDRGADGVSHNELAVFLLCRLLAKAAWGEALPLHCHGKPFPLASGWSPLEASDPRCASAVQGGHLGTCARHRDSLLMCLQILNCGWGKEMDGKVSAISMGNRAMPGGLSVIF